MNRKIVITEDFIDNFNQIYQSDLYMMRAKLIKNDIPDPEDDSLLIKIFYHIENMSESEIREWKEESSSYRDYLQKSGYLDPESDDSEYTNEFYLAGTILLTQSVSPEKIKRFFYNKVNYYISVYLSYKLDLFI